MKSIKLRAMAKINLSLDVVGERPDGYHDLRMVMQSVRLCDQISVSPTRAPGVRMKSNLHCLPLGGSNLAVKAAELIMEECGIRSGVFIDLEKNIPVAAGLAGGSSDAAAVLVAMNLLFELGLSEEKLRELGVRLGADVPFCIMRGTALAEGIGEILTPLPALPDCSILLAKPDIHVSTKDVFGALKLSEKTVHPDTDGQVEAVREGDLAGTARLCGNVLESVTEVRYPVIGAIKQTMKARGALAAMMSGSGPTVFGIFEEKSRAEEAADALRKGSDASYVCVTRPYHSRSSHSGTAG